MRYEIYLSGKSRYAEFYLDEEKKIFERTKLEIEDPDLKIDCVWMKIQDLDNPTYIQETWMVFHGTSPEIVNSMILDHPKAHKESKAIFDYINTFDKQTPITFTYPLFPPREKWIETVLPFRLLRACQASIIASAFDFDLGEVHVLPVNQKYIDYTKQ